VIQHTSSIHISRLTDSTSEISAIVLCQNERSSNQLNSEWLYTIGSLNVHDLSYAIYQD